MTLTADDRIALGGAMTLTADDRIALGGAMTLTADDRIAPGGAMTATADDRIAPGGAMTATVDDRTAPGGAMMATADDRTATSADQPPGSSLTDDSGGPAPSGGGSRHHSEVDGSRRKTSPNRGRSSLGRKGARPAGAAAPPVQMTIADARRLALAAQGFARPRPARVGARELARVIRQMGLLQIDFVNVLVPSHFLVAFSRLGAYDRGLLHRVVYHEGGFAEQWAHEASIVPIETWPLLRHRREHHIARPWGFDQIMARHREYVDTAIDEIRRRGPLAAADLPDPSHTDRRLQGSWYGTVPRAVLEACFGRGQLAVTDRRDNFSRVYDLAERVIPSGHYYRRLDREEAERALLLVAARACGVGTAADLADYFRMKVGDARPRLAELVAAGELRPARVEGWRELAYVDARARIPRDIHACALLSPFDPVVWFRPRTARLFGFEYRFEIFVPQASRRWGSYVLPFLFRDQLVARVDVKTDRTARRLLVPAAFLEPSADRDAVASALGAELRGLATWLGLETIRVGRRGNLAPTLSAALRGMG